jgi:hypothetical protein
MVVLAIILLLMIIPLTWAQLRQGNQFDALNFFRDESGKESSGRAFAFVALSLHSWWVMTMVFQKTATIDHFIWYGVIWSGAPVVMVLAQRWGGNLPFSQAGAPPATPPTFNRPTPADEEVRKP